MTPAPHSAPMTTKLLNCPFCGSENVHEDETVNHWPMVECWDCGAHGPIIDIDKAKSVEGWNTRTAASPRLAAIPTCCVTGGIPGDGGACGDCDPCIMGEPLVPEAVKRIIAEKNSLISRNAELEDAAAPARAKAISEVLDLLTAHELYRFRPNAFDGFIAHVRESLLGPAHSESGGPTHTIDHDGFIGEVVGHYTTREGKRGVVLQQIGTRVVHVYGEKWLKPKDPT